MADLPAATEVAVTVIPTPSDEVVSDPFEFALAEDLFGNDAAADIALSDGCLSDDLFQSPVEPISAGDADEDDGEGPFATNVEPPSDDTPADFRLLATPSTPTHPMHRFQKFVPAPDGRPRHCSQRWLLLYDGRGDNTVAKPKVYAVLDSYLQSVEWMVETRHNGSNDVMPYEVTWKTQMSVKEGHEFAQKIQLGAAFKGLSISTEWESKTFKETETTKSRTEKMSVQIPPGRTLFFYYRRWNFISRTWFVNEWDGQMAGRFRIANDRGQEIVRVTQHSILSSDWAAMLREIKGTGLTKIAPVKTRPVQDLRKWTHYFPDAVQKGLGRVGINPAHG